MKSYIDAFLGTISPEFLKKHTQALMEKELPQTNKANHDAVDYISDLMTKEGLDCERIEFLSDGRKVCQDKIMPMCWDVSVGRLTVVSDWDGERVIADYDKEPFSIVRFSTETPKEGLTARLVTWDKMMQGEDVKGAFVTVPLGMFPTDKALVPVLERGGIGLINGTVRAEEFQVDTRLWANNCSETNSWYVNADERPFVSYCVTPRILKQLEEAAKKGEVLLKAECDGRRFEGKMPAVTGLLKGESDRELWLMAHTAEPLEDDNSAGVISCIQSLISIKRAIAEGKIPKLKYSIRVLFAPELYGYAAFAEHFGGVLRERCIGGVVVDGMPVSSETLSAKLLFAPAAVPFYGNFLLEGIYNEYEKTALEPPFVAAWGDHWGDDCFMSDSSVGLPTQMPTYGRKYYWHNSHQRYNYIDYNLFANSCAVYTAYIAAVAAYDSDKCERFLPTAAVFAINRLVEIASTEPERKGSDANARLNHRLNIELANIRAFKDAGVCETAIENACKLVEAFAGGLNPTTNEKKEATPVYDSFDNIIPERLIIGVPHDFAKVPLERRWHPVDDDLLARVFSAMDGKKTLKEIVTEAEWEARKCWSENELEAFLETVKFMAEFGYIKLN